MCAIILNECPKWNVLPLQLKKSIIKNNTQSDIFLLSKLSNIESILNI